LVNTWKVILATLAIFVAGIVTGCVLVNYAHRTQQKNSRAILREAISHRAEANPREPGRGQNLPGNLPGKMPQGLRMDFLKNLDREIRLTSEQREQIEKIIKEGQERNQQLWNRVLPELRKEMQETRERIRGILTPEQRAQFEELMKQRPSNRSLEPGNPDPRRLQPPPPSNP
jgi:Spy/CpxP family protein refolding chaperone